MTRLGGQRRQARKGKPMAEPLLSIRGVSLALPDLSQRRLFGKAPLRPILQDISLTVAAGECVGLVGESGSGKTTLARTVLRLYEPQQGSVEFAGRDITRISEADFRPLRERMQMIFQDPLSALNPRRRVGDIVIQPQLAFGRLGPSPSAAVRAARARELLALVSLPLELASRYAHELSGGQRQRVGIARAIALQPDLIVADEIVSGLDVSTQARILLLLRELRQRLRMAMIFVTHDLSVVRVLCDRVVVMREGRIVEQGSTQDVFERPQHPYTQALLDAIPLPEIDETWLNASPTHPLKDTAMDFKNTTALVTGANRGLGRELVQQLLAAGARKVYAAARDVAAVQDLVLAHPGRVEALALDITNADHIAAAKARCLDVTLLVNNAGINRGAAFIAAASLTDAQAEINTNYLGTLAMCRAFAPQLGQQGGGAIVNVLTILAKVNLPAMGSLCASKAAALRMTEGVRAELAAQKTLVVAVMTGAVDTDMSRDYQGPKSSTSEVAQAVLAALQRGDEEVYVGDMTGWINGALLSSPKYRRQ
jgi:peptide/nickel transport system ATP-binding protein